jgi:hypothetical protein
MVRWRRLQCSLDDDGVAATLTDGDLDSWKEVGPMQFKGLAGAVDVFSYTTREVGSIPAL